MHTPQIDLLYNYFFFFFLISRFFFPGTTAAWLALSPLGVIRKYYAWRPIIEPWDPSPVSKSLASGYWMEHIWTDRSFALWTPPEWLFSELKLFSCLRLCDQQMTDGIPINISPTNNDDINTGLPPFPCPMTTKRLLLEPVTPYAS